MRRYRLAMAGHRFALVCVLLLAAMPGCSKKNHPPEVVAAPSGPALGRTGVDCLFWASATDPDDDDKVAVRFDWGDSDTSNWSTSGIWRPACTSCEKSHRRQASSRELSARSS